ncbi:hypothetical protein F4806DRAFT_505264 [Annulohypoxylon nitens]|nr:hypothetical protein F4806DRAFT_505264 [Annulohypoxylon nitens]
MDPISALSLAANIAQFADIGISIVQNSREIFSTGTTVSTLHLTDLARDIENIGTSLTSKRQESQFGILSEGDEALCNLATKCVETAKELQECLNHITVNANKGKKWKSVLAAMRTIWTTERINMITKRLLDYRGQLAFRLLVVLNQNLGTHPEAPSSSRSAKIVEVVAINYEDLKEIVGNRHSETAAAIFTTLDGNSIALANPRAESAFSRKLASGSATKTSITYSSQSNPLNPHEYTIVHSLVDYKSKILDSLHFRGISERRLSIQEAHKSTFEWIWHDPADDPNKGKWDSLSQWLQSSSTPTRGCYWLSGKAGSGKSSLMKYLQSDPRTVGRLKEWAGTAQLIVPSFYFWYAGTPLQKSQTGLLRSLLLDILSLRPEMITLLFPNICRDIISKRLLGDIEFTHTELKVAFEHLVKHVPGDLRICFFIDGIDEYTGDHNDICEIFSKVTKNPSIKALLSSRPIPACVYRLGEYPRLRLQDLTFNDIEIYTSERLKAHSIMKGMERGEPGITELVTDKITGLASGVFLWVVLIVRNIDIRLQHYDTAADLINEIDKLPSDLENLYDHMLKRMSERNQILGSKLLQVMLRNFELGSSYPMSALQLSFADDDDYEVSLTTPVKALNEHTRDWRCEVVEGRLRSCCCGLIEMSSRGQSVGFFHRSVVEFLEINTVWEKLRSLTSQTTFDAEMALMNSSILELKAMPIQSRDSVTRGDALDRMLRMISYEKHLSERGKSAFHNTYMPKMREALGFHWHDKDSFKSPQEEINAVNSSWRKGSKRMKLNFLNSIVLSLSLQFTNQNLMQRLREDPKTSYEVESLSITYLILHFVDEKHTQLRKALSKNMHMILYSSGRLINLTGPTKELWNNRWKGAIKDADHSWSIIEFILQHCFSIMEKTEDRGFNFSDEIMVSSLLRVLTVIFPHADLRPPTLEVSIKPRGRMTRESVHISPAVVVSLLAQKIRSTLSQTSGAKLEEITHMLCVLELRFRFSASFSGRDDRQYEPPLALKHHSYSLLEIWRTKWISHDIKKSIYADDGSRVEKHTTSKAYILRSAHNLKHAARNLLQVNLEYPERLQLF